MEPRKDVVDLSDLISVHMRHVLLNVFVSLQHTTTLIFTIFTSKYIFVNRDQLQLNMFFFMRFGLLHYKALS